MKKQEIIDWVVKNAITIEFSLVDPKANECRLIWGDEFGLCEAYGRDLKAAVEIAMFEQAQALRQGMGWA